MPDNSFSASVPVRPLSFVMPEAVPGFSGIWMERAICKGEDPETFYPTHGDPGARARLVCGNCPVQIDCLKYAVAADEWGIWGGLDQEQRRALRDSVDCPTVVLDYGAALGEKRKRA